MGFIFLCNKWTERECLEDLLFGMVEKRKKDVLKIRRGDSGFLYNYNSRKLHGIFEAIGNGGYNVEPNAWKGRFPAQVRVRWKERHKPMERRLLETVIRFEGDYPADVILSSERTREIQMLYEISHKEIQITVFESNFREEFPAYHRVDDGHLVRSRGEQLIDNWLYHHKITHSYERRVPIREEMYCDFYIPLVHLYVEYWGLEDEKYRERKVKKLWLYYKHSLNLVSLKEEDLLKLDDVLVRLLRKHLPRDFRFR